MGEKKINGMLQIIQGDIIDAAKWENGKIDTIVNAAKPTLMGSNQGVDGAIHRIMDQHLGKQGAFNRKICEELKTSKGDAVIRCKRGEAVTTKGYKFCNHIIHVVGTMYDGLLKLDGTPPKRRECTSSCIKTLEACYFKIIEEIKKYADIETVGIPIIGSGEYKVPFELAAEIAIASVGNALVDWRNQDRELFEMAGIKTICFFVYDADPTESNRKYQCVRKILDKYTPVFEKNRKVVYQNSWEASLRYWEEIKQNDWKRGYFAIAKILRQLMLIIRFAFLPLLCLKDLFGKNDWQRRRVTVEWIAVGKVIIPIICWILVYYNFFPVWLSCGKTICIIIIAYLMFDTITYLMMLILMADIQNPSANIIRSLLLLFVNYIEVAIDLAFLCYCCYGKKISILQALAFGFVGEEVVAQVDEFLEYALLGMNDVVKFFFITLALGYFMGHMRQRKFRS